VQRVTSRQNPRLREAAALIASARERRKSGRCVLEGEHVVATCAARHGAPDTLIVTEAALARPAVRALAERHASALVVSESLSRNRGAAGKRRRAGRRGTPARARRGCGFRMLLDGVQDPGNVGSMLRSAAAAGVAQVLLSAHCAFAWSPKVLRAGQGAHFCVDIHEDVDLPAWAATYRATGGEIVAAVAAGGTPLFAAPLAGRVALAIGNEGAGLSGELAGQATQRVSIPMPGGVESLNAAAAAAVCLFECVRRRDAAPGAAGRG
jgi:TrmH family RNA methyltransferase